MTETATRCPDILFCLCCHGATIDAVEEFLEGYEAIQADPWQRLTEPNWFFFAPRRDLALEHPSVRVAVAEAVEHGMVVPLESEQESGDVEPILLAGRALSVLDH